MVGNAFSPTIYCDCPLLMSSLVVWITTWVTTNYASVTGES